MAPPPALDPPSSHDPRAGHDVPDTPGRRRSVGPVFLVTGLVLLLTPPIVFGAVALAEGMGLGASARAVVEQYGVRRLNLLSVAVLSFLPLALLALVVFLFGRLGSGAVHRRALALGGAVPIVAVTAWVNLQFWPVFLPERTPPGFPHGLEFVIGPLFFAPVAMLLGVGVAALLNRRHA